MDILIASDVIARGGVDRYVGALAIFAEEQGHRVTVALEHGVGPIAAKLAEVGITVRQCPLYHRRHDADVLSSEAHALITTVRPHLLHVAAGIPWSCLPLREVAHDFGVSQVVCEQYVPDTLELAPDAASRIQSLYRQAKVVIFVSNHNREIMSRHVDMTYVRTAVIHNAVDAVVLGRTAMDPDVRAKRLRDRARSGQVRLFAAGRYDVQKGFDVLLEACSLLRDRGRSFRLTIFGEGPLGTALADQVTTHALEAVVTLAPWHDNLPAAAADHEAFVLPSRFEGMSYVLLEMMACGIPIIATDVPSSVFALNGGRAGLLVAREDPKALAQALDEVVSGSVDLLPLFQHARHRVVEQFDEQRQGSDTIGWWEQQS